MLGGLSPESVPAEEGELSELREQDLAPHARRALEKAYERRGRERASRADIAAGFIEALVFLGSKSSFREEAHGTFDEERKKL